MKELESGEKQERREELVRGHQIISSEVCGRGVESCRWRRTGADVDGRFGGPGNVEFLRLPLKTKVDGWS